MCSGTLQYAGYGISNFELPPLATAIQKDLRAKLDSAFKSIFNYLVLCIITKKEQDTVTYKFNELIVNQTKVSFTMCEFF